MGRWMEVYLGVQKNLNETLGRALTGMNVPNRDDVAELGQRLAAIEERLARIETLIERGTGVVARPPPSAAARRARASRRRAVRAPRAPPATATPSPRHPATSASDDRSK